MPVMMMMRVISAHSSSTTSSPECESQSTAGETTTNQQSQSAPYPPGHELSEADSFQFSDKEHQPGPSGLSGRTQFQGLIGLTTTPPNTLATMLTPSPTTCVATTSTITNAAWNTVPVSKVSNTTTYTKEAEDSVQVHVQPRPQVRVCRAGATGGQSHEDTETEALATVARVLGAYQQNQVQMGKL
ncbi:uncharacterized protein LOC144826310 [Lissotriton helveticus]